MSNNIVSISTLAGVFSSEQDLKEYCDKQFEIINKIASENLKLKEEIDHLKFVLSSQTEIVNLENNVVKLVVSKEQALIESQIQLLNNRYQGKDITLEDTKILDLLLKNLNIIKNNQPKTIKAASKKLPTSIDDLSKIASTQIEEHKTDEFGNIS